MIVFFDDSFLVYSTPAKEIVQSEIQSAFTSLLATARSDKIDNDLSGQLNFEKRHLRV